MKWTQAQKAAIEARNSNILVSAAAGSGKTAVLTERVVSMVSDTNSQIDIDNLLIVTFTKAAAQEMRFRIQKRLAELAATDLENAERIQRQILLLDSTRISTIDGFCTELLRTNFQELDIGADFFVADESEARLMMYSAIDRVLEKRYSSENNTDFLNLVEAISDEKSDKKLNIILKKLYSFVRNHAFYKSWLALQLKNIELQRSQKLTQSVWYTQLIKPRLLELLEYADSLIKDMEKFCAEIGENVYMYYEKNFVCNRAIATEITDLVNSDSWDNLYEKINNIEFLRLPRVKKEFPQEAIESFKRLYNELKEIFNKHIKNIVCMDSAQYEADIYNSYKLVVELFSLVDALDKEFTQAKRVRRKLDFSDIGQLTLSLLYENTNGRLHKSILASSIEKELKEIMVDEYQDTNEVQEMIFSAISNQNLFMVGDVKQSIYGFRQAKPQNFLKKREEFKISEDFFYTQPQAGLRIDLSENFRTHSSVANFINLVCSGLFSEKIGQIRLVEADMLVPSGNFSAECGNGVELVLAASKDVDEADVVATKIEQLLSNEFKIDYVDASGQLKQRNIQPSDICILFRARTNMGRYALALSKLGIPSFADTNAGIVSTPEIYPIVCFIKLIINPTLEFEICSVLSSYLYDVSDNDLAKLASESHMCVMDRLLDEENTVIKKFLADIAQLKRKILRPTAVEAIKYYNKLVNCNFDMDDLYIELESLGNSLQGFSEYALSLKSVADNSYAKEAVDSLLCVLKNEARNDTENKLFDFVAEKTAYTAIEILCNWFGIAVPECVLSDISEYDSMAISQFIRKAKDMEKSANLKQLPSYICAYLRCIMDCSRSTDIFKVLVSELYCVEEKYLNKVIYSQNLGIYGLIEKRHKSGEKSSITDFYECLTYLRSESAHRTPSELIRILYDKTFAQERVMLLDKGTSRLQNLRIFLDYADAYGNDIQNLYYAVCSIENTGIGDMKAAKLSAYGAVSLMTIHGSKGLEFPVVIVAELNKNLDMGKITEKTNIELNPDYGAAFRLREDYGLKEHKSIGYVALEMENKRQERSEALRLMYVAMTRAKQLLILSAEDIPDASGYTKLEKMFLDMYRPSYISPVKLSFTGSMYLWILYVIWINTKYSGKSFENGKVVLADKVELNITMFFENKMLSEGTLKKQTVEALKMDEDELQKILNYTYKNTDKTRDIKYSVSELVGQAERENYFFVRKPKLLQSLSYSPAEQGTAVHRFLQYVNLNYMPNGIEEEVKRLSAEKFISEYQAKMLDVQKLYEFFTAPLGVRIISAKKILREPRFMYRYTKLELEELIGELAPDSENVMLQGAADCVLFETDGIVVVDYKTDRVENLEDLRYKYGNQLKLYADILSKVYAQPIKELIICSIFKNESISIV